MNFDALRLRICLTPIEYRLGYYGNVDEIGVIDREGYKPAYFFEHIDAYPISMSNSSKGKMKQEFMERMDHVFDMIWDLSHGKEDPK